MNSGWKNRLYDGVVHQKIGADMFGKTWFKWLSVTIVFLLPMPVLFQYLQAYIVRNAVVTARLYEVRAPIDGVVTALDARAGSVPGDVPVIVIRNSRLSHRELDNLEARYQKKVNACEFLQQENNDLNARITSSRRWFSDYRVMMQQDMAQSAGILKTQLKGAKAHLYETRRLRERNSRLIHTGAVSQADFDRIEADFYQTEALVQSIQLQIEQTEYRRRMLRNNLFPSTLSDGVLQVQNQINALFISSLEYKRRLHEARSDLAADTANLQAARADMERRSSAIVRLPDTAVIWDVNVEPGMNVVKGERIFSYMDRSHLMVEVAMDDSTIALIHTGHPARIRMFGSRRFMEGKVVSVLGSAASMNGRFAANIKVNSARDGRVLIKITDPELYRDTSGFCGVGRTAFAEFQGIGLIEQYLGHF